MDFLLNGFNELSKAGEGGLYTNGQTYGWDSEVNGQKLFLEPCNSTPQTHFFICDLKCHISLNS